MDDSLKEAILNDCNNVIYNVFETTAEANCYYREIVEMVDNGSTEEEIYQRLEEMTNGS